MLLALLASGQAVARPACFDLVANPKLTLSGRLVRRVFPGPPNFESVARGDAREPSYILELAKPICADDRNFIDSKQRVRTVHLISVGERNLYPALRAALGKRVSVRGEAFGAQTGHHHALLVMIVDQLGVISERPRSSGATRL